MKELKLYLYDEFTMIQSITRFTSLRWRRKFNDCGDFELHLDDSKENVAAFTMGRHIVIYGREETGLIESVVLTKGDLCVKGRFLECWLYMGIIEDIYYKSERHADSIRAWVSAYIIPQHPSLVLGATVANTPLVRFQTSYKNVGNNIGKLAKAAQIGFRIRKDYQARKYYFDLYRGTDHSAAQNTNPRVYFSDEFKNLENACYEYNSTDYSNYALVMGEGEGSARERVVVDKRTAGEVKRAIYVNASSASREEDITLAEYRQDLYRQGIEKLSACLEAFTGDAVELDNFVYKKDYDLGDIVTLEWKQWGKSSHQRVTEVEEIYEGSTPRAIPVFGDPKPEQFNLEDFI